MMCFFKTASEGLFPWLVFHSLPSHSKALFSGLDNTEEMYGNSEPHLVKDCRQTVHGSSLKPQGERLERYLKARIVQFSSVVHISEFVLIIDL